MAASPAMEIQAEPDADDAALAAGSMAVALTDGPDGLPAAASPYRWCPSAGDSPRTHVGSPQATRPERSSCGSVWTSRLPAASSGAAGRAGIAPYTAASIERAILSPAEGAPVDLVVANAIRDSGLQENAAGRIGATTFRRASLPGTVLLAAALYGLGELDDRPDLADLGLNTGRALVGAGAVTLAGKVAAGRARPKIAPDDPTDFQVGRGLRSDDYQAFPSAHSAAAFAAATVLALDLSDRHPGSGSWIYPTMYSAATMAALSRIIDEEHWLTDTIAGGLIGVVSGLFVDRRYSSDDAPGAQ